MVARGQEGKLLIEEQTQQALRLRRLGLSYRQIGKAMGCSHVWAWRLVTRELDEVRRANAEAAEQIRELQNLRLESILAALWPHALPSPVRDAVTGEVVMPAPSLRHIDRVLKVMDTIDRLNGVAAPSQQQTAVAIMERGGERMASIVTDLVPEEHQDELANRISAMLDETREEELGDN